MLVNTPVAKILDHSEHDEMRIGFRMGLFNLRGPHGFSHGNEEREIARTFSEYAARYDAAKFARIAVTLRGLAETYVRQAERESKRNPFDSE